MIKTILILVFSSSNFATAAEFTFQSKLDRFTVSVTDTGAEFDGNSVSLEPFVFVKPLFATELIDNCAGRLGSPDLTISRKLNDKDEKRSVYIEKKIVSDGTKCGTITGHGLYQLPLHRNWFEGKKTVTIGLGDEFSIWKSNRLVVEFVRDQNDWRNKDKKFYTNWEFFEKFQLATRNFTIDFRVHPAAAKTATTFELRQGSRVFKFVKVGNTTWAVQFPGSPWLAASGGFGLFEDMSQTIWQSPNAKTLSIISDPTAKADLRIQSVRELSTKWGADLNHVLRDVLTSPADNLDVKKEIINLMRSRPTDENFKVLLDTLFATNEVTLQYYLTKALRVRNPKGPVIIESDSDDIVKSKSAEWATWRKTLK